MSHTLTPRRALVGILCLALVALSAACRQETASQDAQGDSSKSRREIEEVVSCDGKTTVAVSVSLTGQARADALMEQWKRDHPDRDWVEHEKKAHAFNEPADNSDVLQGEQGESHSYGDFTEVDVLIWARETEKFVAEGSRIFHSGERLGSTKGMSCDMCHPHARNTHPETYPKFQTQLGRVVLLRDMINWCIEHPAAGKKLDPDSAEMRALEAYIMAQRKGVEMNYGKH